uniref:Cytochrome oxidase assembly protein n=1 Tax=Paulinella chromatophora TaxID=39717 RepID=B1X5E3_PAUCH|nr:hypothetical protein PCC_0747 [Paulinella chromatophora]ACB43162.1 hypothetical protein PCC_0747 [Paulinella chromatophora]
MQHLIKNQLSRLTAHLVVALAAMVGIGGATRVMEAGLACPDWPLCYGSFLPGHQMNLKVFLEWFHRFDALVISIGLLILLILSIIRRAILPLWLPWVSGLMLTLIILQAGLGALTVLQLLPSGIVTAHLAVALLLVGIISACHQGLIYELSQKRVNSDQFIQNSSVFIKSSFQSQKWWPPLAVLTTLVVYSQCLIGGLMATQWAAQRCLGKGEVCQWLHFHRFGATIATALVVTFIVASLFTDGWSRRQWPLLSFATFLLVLQIGLGHASMQLVLSAPGLTIAHQITAAILIATLSALTTRGIFSRMTIPSKSTLF